jgi:cytoskeletal protein CcmA (bactofilin family)
MGMKDKTSKNITRALKNPEIINSIIGQKSEFRGEFRLVGDLRIDGKFQGSIRTYGRIIIGESGESWGNIWADEVIVGGRIYGNIVCNHKIVALSTGKIEGNIASPTLILEKGSRFNGYCKVNPSLFQFEQEVQHEKISEIFKEFAAAEKEKQLEVVTEQAEYPKKRAVIRKTQAKKA